MRRIGGVVVLLLLVGGIPLALERGLRTDGSDADETHAVSTGDAMDREVARGTFEVTLTPQPAGEGLGRLAMEKRFTGDLEGSSVGEMLMWRPEESAAAAYVAIERVDGVLAGRRGSFVLTHRGTMTADEQRLTVEVVPGSASGALAGLAGTMTIEIADGEHRYVFDYDLPETR